VTILAQSLTVGISRCSPSSAIVCQTAGKGAGIICRMSTPLAWKGIWSSSIAPPSHLSDSFLFASRRKGLRVRFAAASESVVLLRRLPCFGRPSGWFGRRREQWGLRNPGDQVGRTDRWRPAACGKSRRQGAWSGPTLLPEICDELVTPSREFMAGRTSRRRWSRCRSRP
jgi:hypothetical protein